MPIFSSKLFCLHRTKNLCTCIFLTRTSLQQTCIYLPSFTGVVVVLLDRSWQFKYSYPLPGARLRLRSQGEKQILIQHPWIFLVASSISCISDNSDLPTLSASLSLICFRFDLHCGLFSCSADMVSPHPVHWK